MVLSRISIAVALLGACAVPPALAQGQGQAQGQGKSDSTMQKLEAFRSTGGPMTLETVPQTGPRAEAIRRNLQKIKLPPGFRIDLYAIVPDARLMAVGPSTGIVFVGTRKNRVWAVTDRTHTRVADEVKVGRIVHQGDEKPGVVRRGRAQEQSRGPDRLHACTMPAAPAQPHLTAAGP